MNRQRAEAIYLEHQEPEIRMPHDITDLLAEAREDLQWRRWVYPRRVMDGVMTLPELQRKIALQEGIVENLQEQAQREGHRTRWNPGPVDLRRVS